MLFGTWDGVFTSCFVNLLGVIVFLRAGWVVGQAGVPLAALVIVVSGKKDGQVKTGAEVGRRWEAVEG